ncbi:MAG: NTP transferase domain-containing protein [Paracoccaceae bacterium]
MKEKVAILILTEAPKPGSDQPDPLLAMVDGQDLLTQVIRRACATGFPVFVTIGTDVMERGQAIAHEPITIVPIPSDRTDISATLRAGINSLPEGLNGALVMLANMPNLTQDDLSTLLTHFAEVGSNLAVSATDKSGHPGHPVILPSRLFPYAKHLSGDQSARSLLHSESISLVKLENGHANTDMDRPENWVSWRADGDAEGP